MVGCLFGLRRNENRMTTEGLEGGVPTEWPTAVAKVTIGEYTLSHYPAGGIWIQHDSGEGMQVIGDAHLQELARVIHEFYKRTF